MMNLDREPELKALIGEVTRLIASIRFERGIPGCSVAVVRGDEIVWTEGFGLADFSKGIPASPRTVYKAASLTKLFTATLLMILRDEGLLHLDDPLSRFVAAVRVKNPFPDPQPMTFRQVASHTAGLPRDLPSGCRLARPGATARDLLKWLRDTELLCPPLAAYVYSNVGYALLGHVLSVAGATPYRVLLRKRVIEPLGLKSTTFDAGDVPENRLAVGYRSDGPARGQVHGNSLERSASHEDPGLMAPAGGLYSSVTDLARFASLQFHRGPRDPEHPLGGTSLREMRSPVLVEPDWSGATAIGWRTGPILDFTYIGHMGGLPGYSSEIMAIPELELAVVVLTNMDGTVGGICWETLHLLAPFFAQRAPVSSAR